MVSPPEHVIANVNDRAGSVRVATAMILGR
jgi:hypothetical protein